MFEEFTEKIRESFIIVYQQFMLPSSALFLIKL